MQQNLRIRLLQESFRKPYGFRTNFTGYTKKGEVRLITKRKSVAMDMVKREEILKKSRKR